MTSLTWARILLASTLGLHIIYAVVGIGLPLLVAVAHGVGLRRHDDRYLILAQSLTRLMVLLFALGAATGMVISFELSLVWSRFMAVAGPVVAAAFAVELVAFFLEGIFLALYVYGRIRIRNAWLHWACLDRELPAEDRDALLAHIASCSSCPQLYRSMATHSGTEVIGRRPRILAA